MFIGMVISPIAVIAQKLYATIRWDGPTSLKIKHHLIIQIPTDVCCAIHVSLQIPPVDFSHHIIEEKNVVIRGVSYLKGLIFWSPFDRFRIYIYFVLFRVHYLAKHQSAQNKFDGEKNM